MEVSSKGYNVLFTTVEGNTKYGMDLLNYNVTLCPFISRLVEPYLIQIPRLFQSQNFPYCSDQICRAPSTS